MKTVLAQSQYYLWAIVVGMLLGSLVFLSSDEEFAGSESVWRSAEVPDIQAPALDEVRLFLGDASSADDQMQKDADASEQDSWVGGNYFSHRGQRFDVAGVVLKEGEDVLILMSSQNAERYRVGDFLPSGGRIMSIGINEITVEETGGSVLTLAIY